MPLPIPSHCRVFEKFSGAECEAGRTPDPQRSFAPHQLCRASDTFQRVSLADVVAASREDVKITKDLARRKDRLIGADSVDDRYATPFYTVFSGPHC